MLLLFIIAILVHLKNSYPVPKVTSEYITDGTTLQGSHVCTFTELSSGEFVAAFQGQKTGESDQERTIWKSLRSKNGEWSAVEKAILTDECVMNPSMYQEEETGRIILFFHKGGGSNGTCSTHNWKGWNAFSIDGGKNFQNYTQLPKGYLGPVKNQCLMMSNEQIICPTSTEAVLHVGIWESHFEFPTGNWREWGKSNNIRFFKHGEKVCQGIIQPTIIEKSPGVIKALFRSGCGVLATATSTNFGKTWPEIAKGTEIPNPNSGIDMTSMTKTDLGTLLVFNNSTKGRSPLNVAYSLDGGESFQQFLDLETTPGGYFAYPFIRQSRFDPKIAYICYTHNDGGKQRMKFVELDFNSQK